MDRITGMSFDTTTHNTGVNNGAADLLEQKIGRKLLRFPCRHHVYEIVLRSVFELKLTSSSAPDVPMFNRFSNDWPKFDHSAYTSGIDDEIVSTQISKDECNDIKKFCYDQLSKFQIRDDYKEFIQLVLIFLGEDKEQNKFKFYTPGPTSNAGKRYL